MDISYFPKVLHVGLVAPDIIALKIQDGYLQYPQQVPYEPENGDRIESDGKWGTVLIRNDEPIGWLAGKGRSILCYFAKLLGERVDTDHSDKTETYTIKSIDDPSFKEDTRPVAVYRKSQVNGWLLPGFKPTYRHHIYLKLPFFLKVNSRYELLLNGINANTTNIPFRHMPMHLRSEAIHCNHLGFHPNDPVKCAYLSCWMGTGGTLSYPDKQTFALVSHATSERVYEGQIKWKWPADKPEAYVRKTNYNNTDLLRMDFADFTDPGEYRVVVDSIGCSYPFRIAEDVWRGAFQLSMKGLYHKRSGVAMEPPFASYYRPRSFHPDDGVEIRQSRTPLFITGNGLNALEKDTNNFGLLVKGATDTIVPDIWGGYMDAADWDRRVQHLRVSRMQLELYELFPEYFKSVRLNIPESDGVIPDILYEVKFNVDCYRRLQTEEGGIRGGIESSEHPTTGECSWQESLDIFAYAPDPWSSYIYIATASKLAGVLRSLHKNEEASVYESSAVRAFQWAEKEMERLIEKGEYDTYTMQSKDDLNSERSLAALELYRLTNKAEYHKIFLRVFPLDSSKANCLDQPYCVGLHDAAFLYTQMPREVCDAGVRARTEQFTISLGDHAIETASGNSWGIGYKHFVYIRDAEKEKEMLSRGVCTPYHGYYTVPAPSTFFRAHALTKDEKFIVWALRGAQFTAGANPLNRAFTSGMGHDPVVHIQDWDSKLTGQSMPTGITVFGPFDIPYQRDKAKREAEMGSKPVYEVNPSYFTWAAEYYLQQQCTPSVYKWPVTEDYFDVGHWAPNTEYTPHHVLGPTSYAWGYLAAWRESCI